MVGAVGWLLYCHVFYCTRLQLNYVLRIDLRHQPITYFSRLRVDAALQTALCAELSQCDGRILGLRTHRVNGSNEPVKANIDLRINHAYFKALMNRDDGDGKLNIDEIRTDREASELMYALQQAICAEIGSTCPDSSVVQITGLIGPASA